MNEYTIPVIVRAKKLFLSPWKYKLYNLTQQQLDSLSQSPYNKGVYEICEYGSKGFKEWRNYGERKKSDTYCFGEVMFEESEGWFNEIDYYVNDVDIENKITDKQRNLIIKIREHLGHEFTGTTKREAWKFCHEHMPTLKALWSRTSRNSSGYDWQNDDGIWSPGAIYDEGDFF